MVEKEIDNRAFLGAVCAILLLMLSLWIMAMYNPPIEYDYHDSFYSVSNLTGYNVTIELYVVALESGADATMATNASFGEWDYIKFTIRHGGQANVTLGWYGQSNAVTVFAVYILELEEDDYQVVNRIIIDEETGYVDILM